MFNIKTIKIKQVLLLIIILLIISLLWTFSTLSTFISWRYNLNHIFIVIFLLYIINLFAYFFSIYQNSKYTSVIKFFWIRVFNIIWFLEFYLFIIFIFLYIISPAELKFFFDTTHNTKPELPNIKSVNIYLLTLTAVFILNYISYYTVYNNNIFINLLLFILVIILLYIFLNELKMYYYYIHTSNFKNLRIKKSIFNIKNNEFYELKQKFINIDIYNKKFNNEFIYQPPKIFILNIILGVKFIHVFLIIFINYIYIYILISTKKSILLEVIGVWQQNLIIILIFWALNYLIFFKFLYKYEVYGFYKHLNWFEIFTNYNLFIDEFLI